jgi:hypothetical protein
VLWVDVAGPPGAGKSTICDPIWGPHDVEIRDIPPPPEWHDFVNEVTRLLGLVRDHPTFVAAVRMNRRSMRKMATVDAEYVDPVVWKYDYDVYCQTGFVQRGLGFGWRMEDMGIPMDELTHFYRLMPLSIGVAFLSCDRSVVEQRNRDREKVRETAHENREHMVKLMEPAIKVAQEVLSGRGVKILKLNTGDTSPDDCREKLLNFANRNPCHLPPNGPSRQGPVLQAPPWW